MAKHRITIFVLLVACLQLAPVFAQRSQPKVDLRPQFDRFRMAVRSQGKRGACQVFAMVGVIEFQLAKGGKPTDLSEQFLMWASNSVSGQHDRTKGFNPDRLIAGLKQNGICNESLMPYVARNEKITTPSHDAISNAEMRKSCNVESIKHWSSKIGFDEKHLREIRRHLDAGDPATATLCWPDGLTDRQIVDANNFIVDKMIDGSSKNGHGVIVAGYGLDTTVAGGGYFIIRNSWGAKFADKGYAKITFDYAKKYGIDAYVVTVL